MLTREISVGDIQTFWSCPRRYQLFRDGGRRYVYTVERATGEAFHRLAALNSVLDVRRFIDRVLPDESVEVRDEIMAESVRLAERARNVEDPTAKGVRREAQFHWFDRESGWTIYAKPDIVLTAIRIVKQQKRKVLSIIELKSAERLNRHHREQLELFALVVGRARTWGGPIELTARLVKLAPSKCDDTRRYASGKEGRLLTEVRSALSEIERSTQENDFQEKPGAHCGNCEFQTECDSGQAQLATASPDAATTTMTVSLGLPAIPA